MTGDLEEVSSGYCPTVISNTVEGMMIGIGGKE